MASDSAWNEGWAQGREASQHRRDRKDMLADEDLRIKASDHINGRNSLLTNLPMIKDQYGEDSQQYKDAVQGITQHQYELGQLFHPDKAPGALQRNWHWLLGKMHGINAPKDNTTSYTTSQAPEMTLNTPAAPITASELPGYQQTTPTLDLDANLHTHPGSVKADVPGVASTTVPGMTAAPPPAIPLTITQSFEGKPAPGMVTQGNLDLSKRPNIDNGDGTHSSTFSMSFGTDKGEVLVPGVGDGKTYPARQLRVLYTLPDGSQKWAVPGNQPHNWIAPERPTPQNNEALNQYQKTGKNFGTFEDEKAADAYGKTLHEDQEKYGHNGVTAHPVSRSGNITLPAGPKTTITKAPAPSWGQAQVLKQKAAAMQKAQQDANLLIAGAPLSPQQQAMSQFRAEDAVHQEQVNASLKLAEKLGITGPALDEFKQQLAGLKNVTPKPLTGAAGQPYVGPDGLYRQAVSNPDGTVGFRQMPPDWKPNTKAIRGTLRNIKGIGFIQTWLDPYNPNKIVGYQKVTPGRQYTGTTSSSSSTDPFGLTTSSSRSTMPVGSAPEDMDLSGLRELPENFNGEEAPDSSPSPTGQSSAGATPPSGSPTSAPPPSVSKPATGSASPIHPKGGVTPSQFKGRVPSPPPAAANPTAGSLPLDTGGHIPANAPYNASLIGAANQLLDGMDITKLTIPQKAKEAASNLARAYGWGGQGMFSPREALQLKEGASFLNLMANSPSLKVLDNGFFSNLPITGASTDPTKEGFFGRIGANLASRAQSDEQQKFMDLYRQLDAMAIGLRALVQSGRGTQKQTDLLISELPNPINTPNSKDAKRRLALVQKELEIAAKTGHLPEYEEMKKDFHPSQGQQHKEGDTVLLDGKKVKIKKIYPDGTFDY